MTKDEIERILEEGDFKERMSVLDEVEDQKILERVAMEDEHMSVRAAATRKLRSQKLLSELALHDPEGCVRVAAVERVKDPDTLAFVARFDDSRNARKIAISKITDEEVLAEVAKSDEYDANQIAAVTRITNMSLLLDVALEDTQGHGGGCAAEKLRDDPVALTMILTKGKAAMARAAAAFYSRDQEVLKDAALFDPDPYVRRCATGNLTDQDVLMLVYSNETSPRVRAVAASHMTDSERLFQIATHDPDRDVRIAAAGAVKDEATLARIIRSDADEYTRGEAAKKIKDPELAEVLFAKESAHAVLYHLRKTIIKAPKGLDLLLSNTDVGSRRSGVEMLDDPEVLYQTALADPEVRRSAESALAVLGRLDLLKKLVCEYENWLDRYLIVLNYIKEQEDIEEILPYVSEKPFAETVVSRIKDVKLLRKISRSHPSRDVCMYAAIRLGNVKRIRELLIDPETGKYDRSWIGKIPDLGVDGKK